jgi:hypothetical protein
MLFSYALCAHLLSVGLLFAGLGIEAVLLPAIRRATSLRSVRDLVTVAKVLGRLFPLATVGLVTTGAVLAAIEGRWHEGWLLVSIALVILMAAGGPLVTSPRMAALAQAAFGASGEAIDERVDAFRRDPLLALTSIATLGESIAVMGLMVLKPAWPVALAVACAFAVIALVAARRATATSLPPLATLDQR